jgi:hypothetical protein
MRRLFVLLAAVGLLGGVLGCDCIHGRCDCDDAGYGCVGCGSCAGGYGYQGGAPYGGMVPPPAGPGYVATPSATPSATSVAASPK